MGHLAVRLRLRPVVLLHLLAFRRLLLFLVLLLESLGRLHSDVVRSCHRHRFLLALLPALTSTSAMGFPIH